MSDQSDLLTQLSTALAKRVTAAKTAIVAIRLPAGHLTGTLWRSDVVVTSDQSLTKCDEFEVVTASATANAKVAGRDSSTNIAVLKLSQPVTSGSIIPGDAQVGAVALAIGADAQGGVSARMGIVNAVGPEWYSSHGGRIDQRIVLDINLSRSEEGGPIFDAAGGLLGMSTFGPRRQVLVIPATTIERVVPSLLRDGHIARGWLGVALRPVAVPEALNEAAGQSRGLMVMSLTDGGPAATAGIVAGDIILTVDSASTRRMRNITARLGADSIGRKVDLRFIRSGAVTSRQATITERPSP
ncbi:MAG: S1C family serine protease [Pseudolabrys sp.]